MADTHKNCFGSTLRMRNALNVMHKCVLQSTMRHVKSA